MKSIVLFIIILSSFELISNDKLIWENSSKGLEGSFRVHLLEFEGVLYDIGESRFSLDSGDTWQKHKLKYPLSDSDETIIVNFNMKDIFKYNGWYFINRPLYSPSYLRSKDMENWERLYISDSIPGYNMKNFSTDSTLLIQAYSSSKNTFKTYITSDTVDYEFEPVETDMHRLDSVVEYQIHNNVLYATTNSPLSLGTFYYSEDYGYNFIQDTIHEIDERIKYIRFFNKHQIVMADKNIYYQEDGVWKKCVSEEYLPEMGRNFIKIYKDKIITHSFIDGRTILVSSSDGGKTWERFGNSDFRIDQLIILDDRLILNTPFGVKVSDDEGKTWKDSNTGIFSKLLQHYTIDIQIVAKGNEMLTAPRNRMINNTIMKSYDNGITWEPKIVDTNFVFKEETRVRPRWCSVVETDWGFFAINGLSHIYKTEDFGETWELFSETSGGAFLRHWLTYERNDTIFSYFNPDIYYSTDGGKTFNLSDISYRDNLPEDSWHWTIIDGIHYALDIDYNLYSSIDDGRNWEFVSNFGFDYDDAGWSKVPLIDGNSIFYYPTHAAVPGESPVYLTKDFGKSWTEFNLPLYRNPPGSWLKHKGKIYVLYNRNSREGIFSTSDEGETWEYVSEGLEGKEIVDIFSAGDYLFATTDVGLFRAFTEDDTSVELESLFPIMLYPNPANDMVNLKHNYYELEDVRLYDITGMEHEVTNFTNKYFEIGHLGTGIYIVELEFKGGWTVTRKFVKF